MVILSHVHINNVILFYFQVNKPSVDIMEISLDRFSPVFQILMCTLRENTNVCITQINDLHKLYIYYVLNFNL